MKVHALRCGEVQIKSRQVTTRFSANAARLADVVADRSWTERLPILAFAIEHPDGLVVVDTGESAVGHVPRWHVVARSIARMFVSDDDELGPRLRAAGLDPADVRTVVMTHMHGDHAGGLRHVAHAELVLSRREAKMAYARTGPVNGYYNAHYPPELRLRKLDFDADPWEGFEASVDLMGDGTIRLVPTPGHTRGHLSVVVQRGEDLVLIVGDAAYSEQALRDGMVDGVAQDARAHRDSTRRLRELCERHSAVVVPSHDPGSVGRLP